MQLTLRILIVDVYQVAFCYQFVPFQKLYRSDPHPSGVSGTFMLIYSLRFKLCYNDKQKHKENEPIYLSCADFTSNVLDISISSRKPALLVFLVLMLMSSMLLVKIAQYK